MNPVSSRRRVLATCGVLLTALSAGRTVLDTATSTESQRDANGWPMEQYDPGGTGYAPSATPPKDGVRVRWKQPIATGPPIVSPPTPVVADGLVYGVGQELVCVDAASGDTVFRADRSFASPPAITEARAYRSPTLAFATQAGAVGLNARGGSSLAGVRIGLIRWQAGREAGGQSLFDFGPSRTVVVGADGTVFVTSGDGLLAIDGSSGRIRWRGRYGRYRPAARNGTVYVAAFGNGVFGYDIETGERTFSMNLPERASLSVTATPERLVVGTSSGLLGVDYDETVRWRYEPTDLDRDRSGVAVANGVAYGGFWGSKQDWLVAIDATNGTELWRSDAAPEQSSGRFAPPAVANGVVYVPTEDAKLVALDASDGHVRWRFTLADEFVGWSPAALVGETLYALGNGYLYALVEQ